MAQLLHIDPETYHQRPEFSSTLAKTLIERSPLHAKAQHPTLGSKKKRETKEMDFGSVVHTIVLGKGKRFEELDYEDFKTKDARKARDDARAAGKVPVLKHALVRAKAAAEKIVANLKDRGITLDGESEVAILWTEQTEHGPVECRCMFDHVWMGGGSARILDLKVTANAAPTFVERNAENMGYAIQEAAYRRALVALEPNLSGRADFLFAFAENDDPFALNLSRGDGLFRDLGEQRWQRALNTWALCMKEQKWPSYGTGINPLSAPAWAFHREEQAQMASEESAA
jgi:hypothetical protein